MSVLRGSTDSTNVKFPFQKLYAIKDISFFVNGIFVRYLYHGVLALSMTRLSTASCL